VLKVSSTFASDQGVLIAIADTGTGIDPKNVDALFDAFFTTKPHGTGMGLAICRSIVEAHGGRLSAAPNEPHGAVFRFTLPVADESSPHPVPSPS
jgi:signal transduction histidine kinase